MTKFSTQRTETPLSATQHLEDYDDEAVTVSSFVEEMESVPVRSSCETYCTSYMKSKMVAQLRDIIVIVEVNYKPVVIRLKTKVDSAVKNLTLSRQGP